MITYSTAHSTESGSSGAGFFNEVQIITLINSQSLEIGPKSLDKSVSQLAPESLVNS